MIARSVPFLILLVAACGKSPAGSTPTTACSGAKILTQAVTSNTSAASAETFTVSGRVVLFGPASGSGTAALSGYFDLGGYTPNQVVDAQIVEYSGCADTGCPDTFDFSFTGATGEDLYGPQTGTCGSGTFSADSSGHLYPSVSAAHATGGENLGLLLTPE